MRFTDGELKVMQLLWEHGEMKPSQLQELFPEPIKNPALRSYLSILVDKGHITRRKSGKAFLYKAKTPEKRAFMTMLSELIDTFCGGSADRLLCTLVQKEHLTAEQLTELHKAACESAETTDTPAENKKSKPKLNPTKRSSPKKSSPKKPA